MKKINIREKDKHKLVDGMANGETNRNTIVGGSCNNDDIINRLVYVIGPYIVKVVIRS